MIVNVRVRGSVGEIAWVLAERVLCGEWLSERLTISA